MELLKIRVLDLHDHFKGKDFSALREKIDDLVHPNEKGHRLAADAIYKHLVSGDGWESGGL